MTDVEKREKKLLIHFSRKIVEMLSNADDEVLDGKPISYNEACSILNYTISKLGEKSYVTLK